MFNKVSKLLSVVFLVVFSVQVKAVTPLIPAEPQIAATSYLVIDADTGKIIAAKNEHGRFEPASLTKMMTEYVVSAELAQGTVRLSDEVTVSEKAWRMEGSRMFIEVNKRVTVEELLKGLIIQSGNDAAVALAEHIAGSEQGFVHMMNDYAAKLGMTGTSFMNTTGLPDPDHYTTARDMATLAQAATAKERARFPRSPRRRRCRPAQGAQAAPW